MSKRTPIYHSDGKVDARYTVDPEYVGYSTPRYVARFEGKPLGNAEKRLDAINIALMHQRKRLGRLK